MQRLERDFVTAWVLAKHLPGLAEEAADPFVREVAARAHANYLYPVDSQIYSAAGELLGQLCANDLRGNAGARYLELLDVADE